MTCLLIIQTLPCVTMKRKLQRDKPDSARAFSAQPRSLTSALAESSWSPRARSGGYLIARIQMSVEGQPPAPASPRLALQPAEVTGYPVQPDEKPLQTWGARHALQLPSASYLSNLSTILSLGHPEERRQEPTYSSRERGLSVDCGRGDGQCPEKDKAPRSLLEPGPTPAPLAPLGANLSPLDLLNPVTWPAPHRLARAPGGRVPAAGESQPSRRPPDSCDCLRGGSPRPSSGLRGLTARSCEAPVPAPNPGVSVASADPSETGARPAVPRARTSDRSGPCPEGAEDGGPFAVPHLVDASHFGGSVGEDHSTEQTPSLIPIPARFQRPGPPPAPVPKLRGKAEPSLADATRARPPERDEFVEIPLDEALPPNARATPEGKARISEPLRELCGKVLPSSLLSCFHGPAADRLRPPAGRHPSADPGNTLSVRVASETPGSGTGLDAGHVWGRILNVSSPAHQPLPWGETFANLLFQEIFRPAEILQSDSPSSRRGREGVRQDAAQRTAANASMARGDQEPRPSQRGGICVRPLSREQS